MLPKTVAIISSPTAAGYGDFVDQLHRNVYGYVFHTKLFPAVMQGRKQQNLLLLPWKEFTSMNHFLMWW